MKKLLSVLLCMLLSVCFISCSNTSSQPGINKNFALQLEDLNFFDSKQEDIIKTTEKNTSYSLWGEEQVEGIELQTYRGLKVGDSPEELLELYDLNDFRFLIEKFTYKTSEITGVDYIDSDQFDSQAKTLNTKYHQEFETATKTIENIDKLPKNYCVSTWMVLYVENGQKVFTETEMRERSDVNLSSLCEYGLYFYVSDSIEDIEVINFGVPDRIIAAESKDWSSESQSQSSALTESSKPSDVITNLEDPFGGGFPANPSYYPSEEYGEPITTGDFGAAIKNLNDGLQIDEGQEVYAYKPPESEYLEIHFSPSDKAIEEKDNQAVAAEYASIALLIIQNYPDYSDTFGDTISVYLGDSTALITATYRNSVPYTSFFPFSQDSALNANLNLAYDTAFGDYDLSNLTD